MAKHNSYRATLIGAVLAGVALAACGTDSSAVAETPVPQSTIATTTTTTVPDSVLQAAAVDEAGRIMVLEYHNIDEPEARWTRTPDNLRGDIERLIAGDFYPINLRDMVQGNIDVPMGKTPVVLTFDDSSPGQCRYLETGSVDPDSACGIMLQAAQDHPDDWRARATFFVLLDVTPVDRILFGQPELVEQKLQDMVDWGFEIGSHTIWHARLDELSEDEVRRQMAVPESTIESLIPGYEVDSFAVALGVWPDDESLVRSGEWEGLSYDNDAAVRVSGGFSPSPYSKEFDPFRIPRIQAFQEELDKFVGALEEFPGQRYISDGDPATVSVPDQRRSEVGGGIRLPVPPGMTYREYPAGG